MALRVIQSFRCKETKQIWESKGSRRLPTNIQRTALRKLLQLHSAEILDDMRVPPANRLEILKGNRAGHTVFALMTSGAPASPGKTAMRMPSKLLITIEPNPNHENKSP
jgi:plasmid maintenance system killer protein